jgi:HAD superfamily hydrolase (TIGR01484 family)
VKPLHEWPLSERRGIVGVFTDIDDTLTTEGVITADAMQALSDLKKAGLVVIPITGRHSGWCAPLALGDAARGLDPWPVNAVVAENGAVAFAWKVLSEKGLQRPSSMREPLSKLYQQDAATRAANALRMQQIAAQVLHEVPGAILAKDEGGRETDVAFDYNETVHLGPAQVAHIVGLLQQAGMHTTVSSIHIHGCFGNFNKWIGACWIVRELFGRDLAQELERWVFVGDSGNDQAMFSHFTHSVGVANIRRFEAALAHLPPYITPSERGAGFAEVARAILQARAK